MTESTKFPPERLPETTVESKGDPFPDLSAGPALRTIAMPADTNPAGNIFGGWLLGQMDIAGGITAARRAGGRVATVGIDAMSFHQPVKVGDEVSCYATIEKIGRSSLRVRVTSWVRRARSVEVLKVTEGVFTYVALDDDGRRRPVPPVFDYL